MKLSENTITTLNNFGRINSGFILNPGKEQRTIADQKTIMAEAVLEDDIPVKAGIYNLPEFLGLIKMMDNPDITFTDSVAALNDGELNLRYRFSSPDLIKEPPAEAPEIENPEAKVLLLQKQFEKLMKIASALGLPNLIVKGGPKGIVITIDDKENDTSHDGTIQLTSDPVTEFSATWQTEHLVIIPDNYNITISLDGISIWENETQTRKYYIPLQS